MLRLEPKSFRTDKHSPYDPVGSAGDFPELVVYIAFRERPSSEEHPSQRGEVPSLSQEDSFCSYQPEDQKVYYLQEDTEAIVAALRDLLPGRDLNEDFLRIVREGTGKTFSMEHNQRWLEETRPILEAFFHPRMMLHLAVEYAKKLDSPPAALPNGWAAVLYLYRLR